MTKISKLICIAKIHGPHGVRGEVKIRSYLDVPEDLKAYETLFDIDTQQSYKIMSLRHTHERIFIARLEGVNDRNKAESLRGIDLGIEKKLLPDLEETSDFYIEDLINLKVRLMSNNQEIGFVKAVHNFGASDLLEIKLNETAKPILVPFAGAWIGDPNLEEGWITLSSEALEVFQELQNTTAQEDKNAKDSK